MLVAWANSFWGNHLHKWRVWAVLVGLFIFIPCHYIHNYTNFWFFKKTILFTLLSLSFALFIPFFIGIRPLSRIKSVITFISITSYSVYLIHRSFVLPFAKHLETLPIIRYGVYWMLNFVLAAIVYYSYERRMTGLRNYFSKPTKIDANI